MLVKRLRFDAPALSQCKVARFGSEELDVDSLQSTG